MAGKLTVYKVNAKGESYGQPLTREALEKNETGREVLRHIEESFENEGKVTVGDRTYSYTVAARDNGSTTIEA